MTTNPIRILIQRADRLGDMVVSLPVIDTLLAHYPNAIIDVITSKIGADLLKTHTGISQIHIAEWTQLSHIQNTAQLLTDIKKRRYDIYIALLNHPQLAWLAVKARIKIRIGDGSRWPVKYLYTHTVDSRATTITQHQRTTGLRHLRPLGEVFQHTHVETHGRESLRINADFALKTLPTSKAKKVGICIGTGGSNSPIPTQALVGLIQQLNPKDWQVVLIGPKDSPEPLKNIDHPTLVKIIDRPLEDAIAAISHLDFYIGPDTGLTHIATVLQKPIVFVAIKKSQFPSRWGPQVPYFEIIRQEYRYCTHSPNEDCSPACTSYITPDLLYQALDTLLSRKNTQDAYTPIEMRHALLLNTLRVLAIAHTDTDFQKLTHLSKKWQAEGLIVIPVKLPTSPIKAIQTLITYSLRYNITVIHGQLPYLVSWLTPILIDKIYQYVKPIIVTALPLTDQIDITDYLDHYDHLWKTNYGSSQ
jgi:ADP-heptose:LPS heptosyltransferase